MQACPDLEVDQPCRGTEEVLLVRARWVLGTGSGKAKLCPVGDGVRAWGWQNGMQMNPYHQRGVMMVPMAQTHPKQPELRQ